MGLDLHLQDLQLLFPLHRLLPDDVVEQDHDLAHHHVVDVLQVPDLVVAGLDVDLPEFAVFGRLHRNRQLVDRLRDQKGDEDEGREEQDHDHDDEDDQRDVGRDHLLRQAR